MLILHEGERLVACSKTIRVTPEQLEQMQRGGATEVLKAEARKAVIALSRRVAAQQFGGGAC